MNNRNTRTVAIVNSSMHHHDNTTTVTYDFIFSVLFKLRHPVINDDTSMHNRFNMVYDIKDTVHS